MNSKILLSLVVIYLELALISIAQLIPHRTKQIFHYENVIQLKNINSLQQKADSYILNELKTESKISVSSIWNNSNIEDDTKNEQILYFEIENYKLFTSSSSIRKLSQNSKVFDIEQNLPDESQYLNKQKFYVLQNDGLIQSILMKPSNDLSLMNFQRGFAGLFQFHYVDGLINEKDALDFCNVHYEAYSSTKYKKIKKDCTNWYLKMHLRQEKPLDVAVNSQQDIDYHLNQEGGLNKLHSVEKHSIYLEAKNDVGNEIESIITLTHQSFTDVEQVKANSLKDAVKILENNGFEMMEIESQIDNNIKIDKTGLKALIKSLQSDLTDDKLGSKYLAAAIVKLLPTARITSKTEFLQILKAQSTRNIRKALLDLLAATQTEDSHKAAMEFLQMDNNEHFDDLEQYLQSLAVGTRSNKAIIEDLYTKLSSKVIENPKLMDTILQTTAAVTGKFSKLTRKNYNDPIIVKVKNFILFNLNECKSFECREMYIRSLQNLQDPSTITKLFEITFNGEKLDSVAAMKALKTFGIRHFDDTVQKKLEKIFYQIPKRFDSTARIYALDIILAMKPTEDQLSNLLMYLTLPDGKEVEIKTHLLQMITMLSNKCPRFASMVRNVLRMLPKVNNYNIMAQKGQSTALYKSLSRYPAFNESLYSLQETQKGVLKQGTVNIVVEAGREEASLYSLSLYARGLSSFVGDSSTSSNELDANDKEQEEEEDPAAGMQIAIQGVQFRPLVFFTSQGELMSHIWSGTASDPTPAYQATTLLQDHEEYLILQNGFTVHVQVFGAQSIDLNGHVSFSLWNRNAHIEINSNTGTLIEGSVTLVNSFIQEQSKFSIKYEPKINLIVDCDFYSNILMCLQLRKPETILEHQINKTEMIFPQLKLSNKQRTINFKHKLFGKTLALNQKNNQMCNKIFT